MTVWNLVPSLLFCEFYHVAPPQLVELNPETGATWIEQNSCNRLQTLDSTTFGSDRSPRRLPPNSAALEGCSAKRRRKDGPKEDTVDTQTTSLSAEASRTLPHSSYKDSMGLSFQSVWTGLWSDHPKRHKNASKEGPSWCWQSGLQESKLLEGPVRHHSFHGQLVLANQNNSSLTVAGSEMPDVTEVLVGRTLPQNPGADKSNVRGD